MDATKDRRKWTAEEDALLIQAMKHFGCVNEVRWTEVAAMVPERTPKACRKRWVNGLNERLKKGSWTAEEDLRLREGVAKLNSDWARIAEHVGQRSGDQCSKRWREVLDPAINKSAWTPEEDQQLVQLYHKHGSAWQFISTFFNNRRALQCRNRCCKLLGLHGSPQVKSENASGRLESKTDSSALNPSAPGVCPPAFSLPPSALSNMPSNEEHWASPVAKSELLMSAPATPDIGGSSMINHSSPFKTPSESPLFQVMNYQNSPPQNTPNPVLNAGMNDVKEENNMPTRWNKMHGIPSLGRKAYPTPLDLGMSSEHVDTNADLSDPTFAFYDLPMSVATTATASPTTPSSGGLLTPCNAMGAEAQQPKNIKASVDNTSVGPSVNPVNDLALPQLMLSDSMLYQFNNGCGTQYDGNELPGMMPQQGTNGWMLDLGRPGTPPSQMNIL